MLVIRTGNQKLLCLANTVTHAVILKHKGIHGGLLRSKERLNYGIQPDGCFHELRRVGSISKFRCTAISAYWGRRYLQSRQYYLFVACHLALGVLWYLPV